MRRLQTPLWLPAILLLATASLLAQLASSRVKEEAESDSPYYVLKVGAGTVVSAEQRLADAVAAEISRTAQLEPAYPRIGRVVLTPVPGKPGASDISCEQVRAPEGRGSCIRINTAGDLIQLTLWRDPSAMPFAYALYLLEPGSTLDVYSTPWIMIQVTTVHEWALVRSAHTAVKTVLTQLGAKRFSPRY